MNAENINIKAHKSRNDIIRNDYFNFLGDKITKKFIILTQLSKKLDKIDGELEIIPNFHEYELLLKYNYNIKQLKQIAKELDVSISTSQHRNAIRSSSYAASIVQKVIERHEMNINQIKTTYLTWTLSNN